MEQATVGKTKLDPITFTVLRHRLDEIIAEAYHTMGRVSGSPVVYEAGDHQEAIGTATGDLAVFGAGVLHWTMSLRAGFKHMNSGFSDNPGINPDDQFLLNDPYVASIHASDIQVLAPVFHDGELIAWAGSASHHTDVGGVDPGGHHVSATDYRQEGFQTSGLKLVEAGVVRRDVERTFANMVRSPELGLLDIRAKIASNNTIKKRLGELVEKYGLDVVKALFDSLIAYSEERIGEKLLAIPDGHWTAQNFVEGIADPQLKVQVKAVKKGDRLTFDFTGTDPQTNAAENIGRVGAMSSAMCPFIFTLAHDIPWNDGLFRRVDFVLPEGSLVNPHKPAPLSCSAPSGANIVVQTATHQVLAKMAVASEAQRDEASADSSACFNNHVLTGLRGDGSFFATVILDSLAGGVGAGAAADGANTAGNEWAVKTMIANVETNEQLYPLMYLWRRETCDSGGPGENRGGVGLEGAIIPWGTTEMGSVQVGGGHSTRLCLGVAGGYPAARTPAGIVRSANVAESHFAQGCVPRNRQELGGERYEPILPKGLAGLGQGDVLVSYLASGGGGFGDPIDRNPEKVALDVRDGYVSKNAALEMYGVAITAEGQIDSHSTERRREEILAYRLAKAEPDGNGKSTDRAELAIDRSKSVPSCGRCAQDLEVAVFFEPVNVGEPDEISGVPSEIVLRNLCCAMCGSLLLVEQYVHRG